MVQVRTSLCSRNRKQNAVWDRVGGMGLSGVVREGVLFYSQEKKNKLQDLMHAKKAETDLCSYVSIRYRESSEETSWEAWHEVLTKG